MAVESRQNKTADDYWSDQNLMTEKMEEKRNGEVDADSSRHPCVKSSTKIAYGTNVYTDYKCRSYSLTGCNIYFFFGKCKPVKTYFTAPGRIFTTDCVCVS